MNCVPTSFFPKFRRRLCAPCVVGVCCFASAFLTFVMRTPAQQEKSPHWSYEGEEGPKEWGDIDPSYATCKIGREQSPIDIRGATKADLPGIQFDYQPSPLKVVDNGHTITVSYAPGSFITVGDHKYQLLQFHFHRPSEELINGKHYDMVAHLVHADADGKLAVVAVLLKTGSANAALQTVWDHLPAEKGKENAAEGISTNAADLLPVKRGYYTFTGSLTTPPCSEQVTWFVLKAPTEISAAEVAAFAKLYPHNARPAQPLNGRALRETN